MEQKREIVHESLQPDARPADVARRHGINTGLLYTWRRQMLEGSSVNGRFGCRARARRPNIRFPAESWPESLEGRDQPWRPDLVDVRRRARSD